MVNDLGDIFNKLKGTHVSASILQINVLFDAEFNYQCLHDQSFKLIMDNKTIFDFAQQNQHKNLK